MLLYPLIRLRVLSLLLCLGHAAYANTVSPKGLPQSSSMHGAKIGQTKLSGNENRDAKPEEERMDTE